MAKKYTLNIPKEKLIQLNNIVKEIFQNDLDRFKRNQVEIRKNLMDSDKTKLWCKYKVRIYSGTMNNYYDVETIGFIQGLFLSTGKARVSDPINFFGNTDVKDFQILNPENLSVALQNMGEK